MKQIFKYPIKSLSSVEFEMPAGAKILTVQMQNGIPCIWALVNPNKTIQCRKFIIFGTGHQIHDPDNVSYIGTFQSSGLVYHLFEQV